MDLAAAALDLARSRPATLGSGRLVAVDGPAGSGKTTLAAAVAALAPGAAVVHLDELYDGWGGLADVDVRLDALLRPLAAGRPGSYERYDWHLGRYAATVTVPPVDLLVVEGVGAGSRRAADLVTVLVWLDAPADVRRERALARDGDDFAPHWDPWARAEAGHFAAEGTRDRADLTGPTG